MRTKARRWACSLFLGTCILSWISPGYAQSQVSPEQNIQNQGRQPGQTNRSTNGAIIYRSTAIAVAPARLSTTVSLPEGIKAKDNPSAHEAIRDVFRTLVNAAVAGDMNKMIEQFAAPDRNRLENYAEKLPADFMSGVRGFGTLWKTRFGSAFNITDRNVFGPQFLVVSTGEISNPSVLTQWPLNPTPQTNVPQERGTSKSLLGRDYLAKGRDVAVVVFPASGDLPELTISMTHEAPDFWKIDIPDNVDASMLSSNLSQHINMMTTNQQQWPPESEEGYRMAAHHILMAVYGIPATQGEGSGISTQQGSSVIPSQP